MSIEDDIIRSINNSHKDPVLIEMRHCSNQILSETLYNIKRYGFDDDKAKVILKCVGEALIRMSFEDHSIDYFISKVMHIEEGETSWQENQK